MKENNLKNKKLTYSEISQISGISIASISRYYRDGYLSKEKKTNSRKNNKWLWTRNQRSFQAN